MWRESALRESALRDDQLNQMVCSPAFTPSIPLQTSNRRWAVTPHRAKRQTPRRVMVRASGGPGPSEAIKMKPDSVNVKVKQGDFATQKQSRFPQFQRGEHTHSFGSSRLGDEKLDVNRRNEKQYKRRMFRDGVSLREIVLGAEMEGVVQNLVRHGAYVDVGAVTDGLVHVRDMDVEFVHSPRDLVRSGDTVKVWVKYVNPVTNVLGLTMVKPTLGFKDRMKISEVEIGKRYQGYVERITNYGAYVDIGAERLGFLHVAAIWGRRPRDTLDQLRLGQSICVHVDDVDEIRSHVKLRARGKGNRELTKDGPLGDLAKPQNVVREDGVIEKSQIIQQRVLLRPGDEMLYEGPDEEEEETGEEPDEFDDYDIEDEGDVTKPGFFLDDDDLAGLIDENTELIGFEGTEIRKEDLL